jgi:cytochrome P450
MPLVEGFSLSSLEVMQCPYPYYREMQQNAPVFQDPITGLFEITGHELIRDIAGRPELFSNKSNRQASRAPQITSAMMELYRKDGFMPVPSLLNNDPPHHRSVRSMVDKAFMPARMAALKPGIEAEVSLLLADLEREVAACGETEFISKFAVSLPLNIIADQLGVARCERETIKRGSDALIAVADPMTPDDHMLEMTARVIAMQCLLRDRIEVARLKPDETILSAVSNSEVDGQPVAIELLIHLFQSILVAGNETTTNALGNGLTMLIDRPAVFDAVAANSALVKPFVEESLRLVSPLQGFYRVATETVELKGVTIPKGGVLMLRWGAGNHDERVFESPGEFKLDRKNASRHLAFGSGIHFCLGNLLARTELYAAFTQIVSRWRNLSVVGERESVERVCAFFNQGVARLPVRFELMGKA